MSEVKNPDAKEVEEMVESIIEWLSKQPHLPHIEDKQVIKKFLINCKYRLQNTKTKIENYNSARSTVPMVFRNRDPCAEEIRATSRNAPFVPLPKRTKDGHIVTIVKLLSDADQYIPADYAKRMFMVFDVLLCEEEDIMDYIVVVDFNGFTFQHFMKTTTVAKTFMDLVQNVIPAQVKGIHYVNVPTFVDRVADFFKLLLKPKLRERIQIHKNMETLYEVVGDRDILPSDHGGKEPSILELSAQYQKKIESYEKWFKKEENIRSNENLRQMSSDSSWLMGTEGSFKKLAID